MCFDTDKKKTRHSALKNEGSFVNWVDTTET